MFDPIGFLLVFGLVGVIVAIRHNARQRRADRALVTLFNTPGLGALFNEGRDV